MQLDLVHTGLFGRSAGLRALRRGANHGALNPSALSARRGSLQMGGDHWWNKDTVAVVTGGNKGIGYEIARLLGEHELKTILTARDIDRGQGAAEKLRNLDGTRGEVVFRQLDIADSVSVRNFKEWVRSTYGKVDILINNAGIAYKGNTFGLKEAEHTMTTNYHGTKMVCEELKELIPQGGRIINVSSTAGLLDIIRSPQLRARFENAPTVEAVTDLAQEFLDAVRAGTYQQQGWPRSMYGVSKLCESMYTRLLAGELRDKGIMVNAVHPGYCATDMSSWRGTSSAASGADTPVYLALLPPTQFTTGDLWYNRQVISY